MSVQTAYGNCKLPLRNWPKNKELGRFAGQLPLPPLKFFPIFVGKRSQSNRMKNANLSQYCYLFTCPPVFSSRACTFCVFAYLLRDLSIDRPNQIWAMDTTYISMRRGFIYLSAVLDWATRRVLTWRLSNSLTADPCVEALEEAIVKYGKPEIMNTDQGSQFTNTAFIGILQEQSIQVSMDGKGCWRDNIFVERLWKSVKYEEIYLHGYDAVAEVRQALARYFDFYNRRRPHSTLDRKTPDTAYFNQPLLTAAA